MRKERVAETANDDGEWALAESPMAKPANHDPSASIAPEFDPVPVPDPEFIVIDPMVPDPDTPCW